MTAQEILEKLKAGNERYLLARVNDGDISQARRDDTATNGQHPDAIVVACSDSRVIPEDIFMAGIGELFVIRVAGNVIGETQLASIEYAAEHLHCPLVVVLGHTKCGAVGAALAGGASGHVKILTDGIIKAIGGETDEYKAACLNAKSSARVVRSKIAPQEVEGFTVAAAVYDVQSGRVEWL